MPTDPVCGMYVPEEGSLTSTIDGQTYYFCSKNCMEKYSSPEKEASKLKRRLIVGWALAVPIILINYVVSSANLSGVITKNLLLFILALPVQFYSGFGFYEGAYHAIRGRMGNMDLLISMGTITAFVYSTYVTFFHASALNSEVFFDASAFIITLILTGSFIENITKTRANASASKLLSLIPNIAHLIDDKGEAVDRKTDEIGKGDKILVRPGETIPADGIVYEGKSDVDESMLTGEQEPVLKTIGHQVSSGTINLNGVLRLTVNRTGKDSTVSQIYELIQRAISGRAKVQRIADIFSSIFVPVVITIALVSSLFWYFYLSSIGYPLSFEMSILAFVSVVVIACPCAIGLAGPITLLISSNYASRNGIIIKNTSSLDRLSKVTRAVFDKTGTLTNPEPTISNVSTAPGFNNSQVLSLAASVELSSNHPIAKAIVLEAKRLGFVIYDAQDITEIPGIGISGKVNGNVVNVTRSNRVGGSQVSVQLNGQEVGTIALDYKLRESAVWMVSKMKEMGIKTTIVTGDSDNEAKRIAGLLGIDSVHAEVSPAEKSDIIMNYQKMGDFVMFTGDGINDTVALETADVGIAMGSGTDIARESGDIILLNNDLKQIVLVKLIGEGTISKIKQNIGWAVGYNSVLIPIAAGVLVPLLGLQIYTILPMLAALAMGMSSTSVVLNSLTLRRKIDRAWEKRKGSSDLSSGTNHFSSIKSGVHGK
ncbi:MAG: heavy metal translocating P-type ATPase [Thermoplasmatales archaeon]